MKAEASRDAVARGIAEIESCRERERIRTYIIEDPADLTVILADRIVRTIRRETAYKGRCVLGLATGSTPVGIYRELIGRYEAGEVDFSNVITFNLDEYYSMSPDKHQSQKDVAPFPCGYDEREFWQRVEARNLATAAQADRLGLPEYNAMEAYRVEAPTSKSESPMPSEVA